MRLIDAHALRDALHERDVPNFVYDIVDEMPTIRKTDRWVGHYNNSGDYELPLDYPYVEDWP